MIAPSGKALLRAVVCTIFTLGLVSAIFGSLDTINRGVFNSQLVAGIGYMALGIWLFRGSNIARIILACLFFAGLLAFFLYALVVDFGGSLPT